MFGLKCILRYMKSLLYHLSVSEIFFSLFFSINLVFMCEFSWIEMFGVLGARRKGVWIAKKVTVSFVFGVGH